MSKVQLEQTTSAITKTGDSWMVVIAAPGKGSHDQTFTREVLEQKGPAAWPARTRAYIGHALPEDRDPRDQLGSYPMGAYYAPNYKPEKYPEGALVAKLKPRKEYVSLLEELDEDADFSIFADGETDDDGNVIDIYPAKWNTVDLVAYAGLEGSGLQEKLHESYLKPSGDLPQEKDKEKMEKEIQDAIDNAVKTAIDAFKAANAPTPSVKTDADVEAEVASKVEEQLGAKVDEIFEKYEESVAAIEAAQLLPTMVESLKIEARKGVDLTPLIESAKKVVDEARTVLNQSYVPGETVSVGEGNSKVENWSVQGMSVN